MNQLRYILAAIVSLATALEVFAAEPKDLGEWLDLNNPKVIAYLKTLRDSDVGKPVAGVKLVGEGERELAGLIYLGRVAVGAPTEHVYRFREESSEGVFDVHYIWVDKGGKPADIPKCGGEWIVPNGIAVLSGDVYTWNQIQPGDGVVRTTCRLPASSPNGK